MAFDGIVTKQVVNELNTCLTNGKINKVHEPNKNEIILGIYSNGKNYALLINIDSSNYRTHLTTTSKPNPLSAPNFCMLLRKHLIGMKINSIESHDLERVITIELEGFDELNDTVTKKLVIELMGKHSNIILLNQNMRIIDSLRHTSISSNATRDILPAHEYIYPTSNKYCLSKISSFEEFYKLIENELNTTSINTVLVNKFNGISNLWINFLLDKLNISNNPSKTELEKLYNTMNEVINSNNLCCVPYNDKEKGKNDYTIFLDKSPESLNVNFFLDDFYSVKETDENFKNYRNSILKLILGELNKYKKRLANINQKLCECEEKDKYKLYGELITANLYRLYDHENTDSITLQNYFDNNNNIDIPLDKTLSPALNAKKYFKRYNKLKNACEIASQQKKDTKKEIDYIESIVYELEKARTINDIDMIYEEISENIIFRNKVSEKSNNKRKTKVQNTPSLQAYVLDGYTIYIGKNNKQNDYLTLKFANKNDIWFHTKDIHGSHVILKTDGNEVSQELINKCASIAAFYSKASLSSNVPVDYTFVRYVKKPSNAKPGMVIYTNYNTVNVIPNTFNL